MTPDGLPRLLYVGDVPVSNTFGGATFLYRLLQRYPPDKLLVCAPIVGMEAPLPGVRYVGIDARWPRLLHTRFGSLYCAWITWRLNSIPRWSLDLTREFRPEAVLTISQTGRWLLAWRLAQREGLPLYMFVHDDHVFYRYLPQWLWPWAQRCFGEAYRYATGRFCISASMADLYERRYGVPGNVVYPTRDPKNPVFLEPAGQTLNAKTALTFAFAGSLYGEPSLRQILAFARAAADQGHRLVVYSPQHESLRQLAAGAPGVDIRSPVPNLIERLHDEADCLLVIGSFEPNNADVVNTQFPSKMADYSAAGLPLFVWAPPDTAIARFVQKHSGVAESVTDPDPKALAPAIERLATADHRYRLAKAVIDVGAQSFSPEAGWESFARALLGSSG